MTLLKEERTENLRRSNEEINLFTKECLGSALIKLMGEMPLEKIKVTQLVRKAGVSRASFYRNYRSKEDIIEEQCERIIEKWKKIISDNYTDEGALFNLTFEFIKENAEILQLYMKANITRKLIESSLNFIIDKIHDTKISYRNAAIYGMFNGIAYSWILGGMKESAKQMADLCIKYFRSILS